MSSKNVQFDHLSASRLWYIYILFIYYYYLGRWQILSAIQHETMQNNILIQNTFMVKNEQQPRLVENIHRDIDD